MARFLSGWKVVSMYRRSTDKPGLLGRLSAWWESLAIRFMYPERFK